MLDSPHIEKHIQSLANICKLISNRNDEDVLVLGNKIFVAFDWTLRKEVHTQRFLGDHLYSLLWPVRNRFRGSSWRSKDQDVIVTLSALPKPDSETRKRLQALKAVIRLKKRDVARKECWRSGDAVIAIEAPDGAEIVTHNCKHFTPICTALGKPLRCY